MKRLNLILLLLMPILGYASKPDSINVRGEIRDSFTKEFLEGVEITVMYPDSSVIHVDSTSHAIEVRTSGYYSYTPGGQYSLKVPGSGTYLIKIQQRGYQTKICRFFVPLRKYAKWVRDWNENFEIEKIHQVHEVQLGEAVVKATKIKMVMKRDTIVFNADAFQLSQGSMLAQLVAELPGMKLNDGGDISYNGEHVSSLLVNGKDFFKGNPQIALQNLPAYMVNKIKIYRRSENGDYLNKDLVEVNKNKKLVVDVNLKKQYNQGWIIDAEASGGSNHRYMERATLLRYTDHSKFFVFGNFNNMNDTKVLGNDSYRLSSWIPVGLQKLKMGGLYLDCDDKKNAIYYHSDLTVKHLATDEEMISSSETYLNAGNIYGRNYSLNRAKRTDVSWKNDFSYSGNKLYLQFWPNIQYFRRENNGIYRSANFNGDPKDQRRGASIDSVFEPASSSRLNELLINKVSNSTYGVSKSFFLDGRLQSHFTTPLLGNDMEVKLIGFYNHDDDDLFSHYNLYQPKGIQKEDFRNQYTLTPSRSYYYITEVGYQWIFSRLRDVSFNVEYSYEQDYLNGQRELYRLDSLSGWNTPEKHSLGALPSTTDSLHAALDWQNSYYQIRRKQNQTTTFSINKNFGEGSCLSFSFPFNKNDYIIRDTRNNQNRKLKHNLSAWSPTISLFFNPFGWKIPDRLNSSYNYEIIEPHMLNYLDVIDNANPLIIQSGNPNLKDVRQHSFNFSRRKTIARKQKNISITALWHITSNAVAQAMTYDRSTGVRTYKPQNINGNWDVNLGFDYGQAVDSMNHINVSTSTKINYQNNVDYCSERGGETVDPYRSSVRNLRLNEDFQAVYNLKTMRYEGHMGCEWVNLTSRRDNFNKVNAVDFKYGVSARLPLLLGTELNTDLTMYSRRGYNDASMNDDNLVWNADVTKSFLKSKNLILKLEGFDLLHQLDNVRTEVNAQGRTETWYNVVPSYLMLHLIYRLNVLPKKKN